MPRSPTVSNRPAYVPRPEDEGADPARAAWKYCAVAQCKKLADRAGYCRGHYGRKREGKSLAHPLSRSRANPPPKGPCKIEGCERGSYCKGYCEAHYARARKGIIGGEVTRRARDSKRAVTVKRWGLEISHRALGHIDRAAAAWKISPSDFVRSLFVDWADEEDAAAGDDVPAVHEDIIPSAKCATRLEHHSRRIGKTVPQLIAIMLETWTRRMEAHPEEEPELEVPD